MRVVDLFAGCGGLSKGFEQAGFELTLAVEQWEAARTTYSNNFHHPVSNMDLSEVIDATKLIRAQRPDLIIGGPPCQEFSVAGSRVEGPRAQLTVSFSEIVRDSGSKWFMLENVQGIRNSDAWIAGKSLLEEAGYGITECVLNAAYFGVPQNRKRFFAIGCLGEKNDFLLDQLEVGATDNPLSIRDFLGDEFGIEFYYRHPRNWGRRGIFSIDEPSPTIRSTNRSVSPGYTPHPDDAGPSTNARRLSTAERARVQSFSRDFKFSGSMTDQNTMIANAVPVLLAQHVASAIARYEEERLMFSDPHFRQWLAHTHEYTPKTVSNVISRVKRASRILHANFIPPDPLDAINALERRKEFIDLSSSVRSQIKKAIKLHAEFHRR
ncbi:DNA cytosine methyltransferase [Herminiimonas glaciei]|uniref:Cytosine-specific methyltransferase n=1 Tax=Herminiimonas glaciei TaxID=523788 RepID=A0ABW2ID22_9BURK